MDSIYERLMDLPLFKGASRELINSFAERTPLEFKKYSDGDVIISDGELCEDVVCLIKGTVRREKLYCCGRLVVTDLINEGNVLGVEHLFGLDHQYNEQISAVGEISIMKFSKSHYLRTVQDSRLLLINYLNYLSRMAQNSSEALRVHNLTDVDSEISYLIQITTAPFSTEITLKSLDKPIGTFLSQHSEGDIETLKELSDRGLIEFLDPHTLYIPSRLALLDAFRHD